MDVRAGFDEWADAWPGPGGASAGPVPDWMRRDTARWAAVLREHAPMSGVVHWDIRVDNLLRAPGG